MCSALRSTVRSASPVPETVPTDLAGSRDRMVAYLDQRLQGTTSSISGVNAAGPAPLEGGGSSTDAIVGTLNQRLGALRESRESLAAIPANSDETLFYGLQRARAGLVLPGPDAVRDLAIPAPLAAEATAVSECRTLTTP